MGGADLTDTEKQHEIPYAQRAKPIRRFTSQQLRLFAFPLIFVCILLTLFASKLIFPSIPEDSFWGRKFKSLPNLALLGHLPYSEAKKENLVELYPGLKVHKDMFSDLIEMRNAANRDGINLVFLSGFRSIGLQKEIFYENKSIRNQTAIERAKVSAPPGYSEHSTGFAIDIGDRNFRETDFELEFESTPAFLWLKNHAAKYHFVLSFPRGNPQKVSYEPWHWRYEGTVQALKEFEPANKIKINQ